MTETKERLDVLLVKKGLAESREKAKALILAGNVYVNDQKQNEVYLDGVKTPRRGDFYDVTVPEGYVFVMGDNRAGSSDSREFGCIPLEKVEGRVKIRIWPLSQIGKIDK